MDQVTINLVDPTSKLSGLQREYISKIMDSLYEMECVAEVLKKTSDIKLVKAYVKRIEELDVDIQSNYEVAKGIEERAKQYAKVS